MNLWLQWQSLLSGFLSEAENASQCSLTAFEASSQDSPVQVPILVSTIVLITLLWCYHYHYDSTIQCVHFNVCSGLQQQSTSPCCRHIFTIQHRLVGGQRQATQVTIHRLSFVGRSFWLLLQVHNASTVGPLVWKQSLHTSHPRWQYNAETVWESWTRVQAFSPSSWRQCSLLISRVVSELCAFWQVGNSSVQSVWHWWGYQRSDSERVVCESGRQGCPVWQHLRGAERQGQRHHHQQVRWSGDEAILCGWRHRTDGWSSCWCWSWRKFKAWSSGGFLKNNIKRHLYFAGYWGWRGGPWGTYQEECEGAGNPCREENCSRIRSQFGRCAGIWEGG